MKKVCMYSERKTRPCGRDGFNSFLVINFKYLNNFC